MNSVRNGRNIRGKLSAVKGLKDLRKYFVDHKSLAIMFTLIAFFVTLGLGLGLDNKLEGYKHTCYRHHYNCSLPCPGNSGLMCCLQGEVYTSQVNFEGSTHPFLLLGYFAVPIALFIFILVQVIVESVKAAKNEFEMMSLGFFKILLEQLFLYINLFCIATTFFMCIFKVILDDDHYEWSIAFIPLMVCTGLNAIIFAIQYFFPDEEDRKNDEL